MAGNTLKHGAVTQKSSSIEIHTTDSNPRASGSNPSVEVVKDVSPLFNRQIMKKQTEKKKKK